MQSKPDKSKTLLFKLRKRLLRPFWQLRDLLFPRKYRPKKYWKARHAQHGFTLRGVGNWTHSNEENEKSYLEAKAIFLNLCAQQNIDFKAAKMLDIGCGTGFYAEVFRDNGGKNYVGIDITNQLFKGLRNKFPDFTFKKCDIAKQNLKDKFDLIIMIDVTQHIVDDKRFTFAMRNIRSHLGENGVFIVTSDLSDRLIQSQPHVVARPIAYYHREFPDYFFSQPLQFRGKFIFAIKKDSTPTPNDLPPPD